jgi:hypothetical protein
MKKKIARVYLTAVGLGLIISFIKTITNYPEFGKGLAILFAVFTFGTYWSAFTLLDK